ncbi:MAG: hypothetical protein HMLKMBBP_01797 [Planctomycetes bacterium]|nr:hypothetical protein [Planctomycetota bacterium]
MKRIVLAVALAASAALPACTTMNPERRTMTDWSIALIRRAPDPCGNMPGHDAKREGCGNMEGGASRFVDAVFVKPIAFATLPVTWALDTALLNPIDGWKKAQLQCHERLTCVNEQQGDAMSNAHADFNAGGVIPVATPWLGTVLYAPEFAARWVWNSVYPTDPVNQDDYNAYWQQHNEKSAH